MQKKKINHIESMSTLKTLTFQFKLILGKF